MVTVLLQNLGIVGACIAFAWSVIQFVYDKRKERHDKEFEAYHRLIKELVSPDPESKLMWMDRQAAVIYELRHFPRYYEYTGRMLVRLKAFWTSNPQFHWPFLIDEIDRTLAYIQYSPEEKGPNNIVR